MRLDGQLALVSGGGRGIGQAISVRLASHGADIVIADLDEDEMEETKRLVREEGQQAHCIPLDLRDPESIEAAVSEVLDEFETIDILVNNAGIAGPTAPCEDISVEEWDQTLHVNLRGMFLMCSEVLSSMKEVGYGRIVNIASITGKRPLYNRTPYAASKMGVIGFTRTLASEVGEFDINVNAICPGSVMGPRLDDVYEKQAEAKNTTYEEIKEEEEKKSPRRELVQSDDIARTTVFLCSEHAERMTGQDINVTAGKVMY